MGQSLDVKALEANGGYQAVGTRGRLLYSSEEMGEAASGKDNV